MIREATIEDAAGIAEVQVAAWHAAYRGLLPDAILDGFTVEARTARWRENLREAIPPRRTAVLERDGAVVAWATSGPARDDEGLAELWALYAHPRAWSTGAGRALLEDALAYLGKTQPGADTILWVLEGNERAIRFYRRAGFELEGPRKIMEDREHVRMRRPLAR